MRRSLACSVTVAALALALAASAAAADTIVPAGDLPSQTWTVAGSPYIVQGDIAIQAGFSLVIEPGVMVVMAGGGTLEVWGTLHINGTAASPVTITSPSAMPGGWDSIDVLGGAANVRLDHVTLEYPHVGVFLRSTTTTSTFTSTGLTVRDAQLYAFRADAGHPRLDRFTSIRSRYGIYLDGALLTITNCLIQGRPGAEVGILGHFYATPAPGEVVLEVINCTIDDYGHGMSLAAHTAADVTFVVTSSIIARNRFRGIINSMSWGGTGVVDITYSNVWGNLAGNYDNVTPGSNTISVDPGYESPTSLRLGLGSPCIDRGTNQGAPAHDLDGIMRPIDADGVVGAVTDMGAYERVPGPSQCGNGAWEPGEACDDGAGNGQYGLCNATCTGIGPRCGDTIINGPEQCDDGNTVDTDACRTTCVAASCGDGVVRTGVELCDSGLANGQYGSCNTTCSGPGPRCGDAMTNGPEQCDDGNASNTDACLGTCLAARCGDGFLRTGVEACDDGNTSNTDSCVGACAVATCGDGFLRAGLEVCDDGNSVDTDACRTNCIAAICGDGVVHTGVEVCDDGNSVDTDACRTICFAASCGDGVVHTGVEACDDGNQTDTDACRATCVAASCGDGVVHTDVEACDDGNQTDTDACRTTCFAAYCGDGVVHTGAEACDDGNQTDTDACTSACASPTCGDGIVQADVEACDDGNQTDTDACRNVCIAASCGDGVVHAGIETCDDGNLAAGDGCDATCSREPVPDGGDGEPADPGGCCSTGGTSRDTGLLATLAVLIGLRRRRRRPDR